MCLDLMTFSLSPCLWDIQELQRETSAKLEDAQRLQEETERERNQAQVPIARARMSSTHLMSDVMFARLV